MTKPIVIVGLPGSGKTTLMQQFAGEGYELFDNIKKDWDTNIAQVKSLLKANKKIVMSDITFCDEKVRNKLLIELGVDVEWIMFENSPWQCAKNCLYRYMTQKPNRKLQVEINFITNVSPIYNPGENARPVAKPDANIPEKQ